MKIRKLKIILEKISKKSYLELDKTLSKIEGITCSGLDKPTKKLEMIYDSEVISKQKILKIVDGTNKSNT